MPAIVDDGVGDRQRAPGNPAAARRHPQRLEKAKGCLAVERGPRHAKCDNRRLEGLAQAQNQTIVSTLTPTERRWLPPPSMIPRNGETSPKSRPQSTETWSVPTKTSLVGSNSTQPNGGANTATHACDAPQPTSAAGFAGICWI